MWIAAAKKAVVVGVGSGADALTVALLVGGLVLAGVFASIIIWVLQKGITIFVNMVMKHDQMLQSNSVIVNILVENHEMKGRLSELASVKSEVQHQMDKTADALERGVRDQLTSMRRELLSEVREELDSRSMETDSVNDT
jgi:hypothetical protein